MANKTTHTSRSFIDCIYTKRPLMEEFITDVIIENIYFPDHVAARIVIGKNPFDFHIKP